VRITVLSPADCQLELWGVENQLGVFRSVFRRRATVRVEQSREAGDLRDEGT